MISEIFRLTYDSRKFVQEMNKSQQSVDDLKKDLDMSDQIKSLEELDEESKKLDFKDVNKSANALSKSFSALEIIATTALVKITSAALDTGAALVKSLTIDQITSGWQKFENETISVGTIMSATGKTIEEVEKELDKLAWFTDETSYNFEDMVANVGNFTSAGVELGDAVTAMEGIATWAALSGANSEKASHAMYALSKAMGSGNLALTQWQSLVSAGMVTEEFRKTLVQTAAGMGTLTTEIDEYGDAIYSTLDGTEVKISSLETTLAEDWATSGVLTATLQAFGEYADELYNVMQEKGFDTVKDAMDALAKDTKEYTDFTVADLGRVAASGKEIQTLTEAFYNLAASEALAGTNQERLKDDKGTLKFLNREKKWVDLTEESISELISTGWATSEVWETVYDRITDTDYKQAIHEIVDSTDSLGKRAFLAAQEARTLTDAINSVKDAASTVWLKVTQKIFGNYEEAKELFTELSGYLYDAFVTPINGVLELFDKWNASGGRLDLFNLDENDLGAFWNILNSIGEVANIIKDAWREIFAPITSGEIKAFTQNLQDITKNFQISEETAEDIRNVVKGIASAIKSLMSITSGLISSAFPILKEFGKFALSVISDISSGISEFLNTLFKNGSITKLLNSVSKILSSILKIGITLYNKVISPIAETLLGAIDWLIATFGDSVIDLLSSAVDWIGSLLDSFAEFLAQNKTLEEFGDTLQKVLIDIPTKFNEFFKSSTGVSFPEFINGIIQSLTDFLESLSNFNKELGKETDTSLDAQEDSIISDKKNTFWDNLADFLRSVTELLTEILPLATAAVDLITTIMRYLNDFIDNMKNSEEYRKEFAKNAIIFAVMAVLVWVIIKALINIFNGISTFLSGPSVTKALKTAASGYLWGNIGYTIEMFALAVLSIAVAINSLSKIDKEAFERGLIALILILGLFALLVGLLADVGKTEEKSTKTFALFDKKTKKFFSSNKSGSSTTTAIEELGSFFLKISIALVAMSYAISKLASTYEKNQDGFVAAAIVVGALIAVIGAIVILMAKLPSKGGKEDAQVKLVKGLSKVILSLGIVVLAMSLLKSENIGAVIAGSAAIAVLLGIIASMVIAFSNLQKEFGSSKMDQLHKQLNQLVGVIVVLSGIIVAFSLIPGNIGQLWSSIAAVVVLLGSLVAMIEIFNKMEIDKTKVTEMIGIAYLIVGLMAILSVILILMANLANGENGWQAVGMLAASLIILIGALALFGVIAQALSGAVIYMLAIGAAFVLVGAGAALLASSIYILAAAFDLFVSTAEKFIGRGDEMTEAFSNMAKALAIGIVVFVSTLAENIAQLSGSIMVIILGTLDALIANIGEILMRVHILIAEIIKGTVVALIEQGPVILQGIIDLVFTLAKLIFEYGPALTRALVELVKSILYVGAYGIGYIIGDFIDLLITTATGFVQGLMDGWEQSKKALAKLLSNMGWLGEQIAGWIGLDASDAEEEAQSIGENIDKGIAEGVEENSDEPENAIAGMTSKLEGIAETNLQIASPSKIFKKYGHFIDAGLAEGISSDSDLPADEMDNMLNGVKSTAERLAEYINQNVDIDPTIRPIMDLTDIQNGISAMSGFSLAGTASIASATSGEIDQMRLSKMRNESGESSDSMNQSNVFYINGAGDPKKVADEVSKILGNQIAQKKRVFRGR